MRRVRVIRRTIQVTLVAMVTGLVVLSVSDRGYAVWLNTPRASYGVSIGAGALGGYLIDQPYSPRSQPLFKFTSTPGTRRAEWLPRFQRTFGYRVWVVPIWLVLALGLGAFFIVRGRRKTSDACPNCRYPLRGLKPAASGARVCPECGSPIEALRSEHVRGAGADTPTKFAERGDAAGDVDPPIASGQRAEHRDCAGRADTPPARGGKQHN